jgi:hypothetical protein
MLFSTVVALAATVVPVLSLGLWTDNGIVADDQTWQAAICKGNILLSMMHAPDSVAAGAAMRPPRASAQTIFNDFPAEFTKWNYIDKAVNICDMTYPGYGVEAGLAGMGISASPAYWKCYHRSHGDLYGALRLKDQTYTVNGKTYRVSWRARYNHDSVGEMHLLTHLGTGNRCILQDGYKRQSRRYVIIQTHPSLSMLFYRTSIKLNQKSDHDHQQL